MLTAFHKSAATLVLGVGALVAATSWAADTTKKENCCEAKSACCKANRACCTDKTKAGCCEKGMTCCANNQACCAKAPDCCKEGKPCCKEGKACCGVKDGDAVSQTSARPSCCAVTAEVATAAESR